MVRFNPSHPVPFGGLQPQILQEDRQQTKELEKGDQIQISTKNGLEQIFQNYDFNFIFSNLKFVQEENEKVLKDYLLAHQQGVGCQLPTSPITINDFKQAYQVQTQTKF